MEFLNLYLNKLTSYETIAVKNEKILYFGAFFTCFVYFLHLTITPNILYTLKLQGYRFVRQIGNGNFPFAYIKN